MDPFLGWLHGLSGNQQVALERQQLVLMRRALTALLLLGLAFPAVADLLRDKRGRIYRDSSVVREFRKTHPCPATGERGGLCPGFVIDHVTSLACGGPDIVENLTWQTVAEAREKDRIERKVCRGH